MICAGIIDNTIVGPNCVPEGVKLTFETYCELLKSVLLPWPEDLSLPSRRQVYTLAFCTASIRLGMESYSFMTSFR